MDSLRLKLKKYPIIAVFSTIFIDMLGVGILIPVFPLLVLPNSPERVVPLGWSVASGFILLGWLSAAYPLALFFAAPFLGELADKYGRRKILALSISGTSIAYAMFAIGVITKNIPLLFASRIIDGFTGGNISVAQAAIADVSTPKNRARNFGLVGMAFGLGFILGPYIGGKLADPSFVSWFSASTPFWFASILSGLNVLVVLLLMPETLKVKAKVAKFHITKAFKNVNKAFTRKGLRNITPSSFLFSGGFTFFTTFFAIYLATHFGFKQGNTGDYFAYVGLWIAIVQGGLVAFVSKKLKDYQVLRISMFGVALTLLSYLLIPDGHYKWLFVVPPFLATFVGLTQAFTPTIVSRVTPPDLQGESLGINISVSALAQAIPAVIAGYTLGLSPHATIIGGSILTAAAGLVFWIIFKPGKSDSVTSR